MNRRSLLRSLLSLPALAVAACRAPKPDMRDVAITNEQARWLCEHYPPPDWWLRGEEPDPFTDETSSTAELVDWDAKCGKFVAHIREREGQMWTGATR